MPMRWVGKSFESYFQMRESRSLPSMTRHYKMTVSIGPRARELIQGDSRGFHMKTIDLILTKTCRKADRCTSSSKAAHYPSYPRAHKTLDWHNTLPPSVATLLWVWHSMKWVFQVRWGYVGMIFREKLHLLLSWTFGGRWGRVGRMQGSGRRGVRRWFQSYGSSVWVSEERRYWMGGAYFLVR